MEPSFIAKKCQNFMPNRDFKMVGLMTILSKYVCLYFRWNIPIWYFNVHGYTHGSLVADWGSINQKLEDLWENVKLAVSWILHFEKFMYFHDYMSSDKPLRPEQLGKIQENRVATSICQIEKWGMHGLHAYSLIWRIGSFMKRKLFEGLH